MLHAVRVIGVGIALFGAAFLLSGRASAAGPPQYQMIFGQGLATPAEVDDALGQLTYTLTACQNAAVGLPRRSVRVTSEKSDYENPRVAEAVLYWATLYAWRACPLHVIWGMTRELPQFRYEVSSFELYLPDGSLALRATGLVSTMGPYRWSSTVDIGLSQRRARAAQQDPVRRNVETTTHHYRGRWSSFDSALCFVAALTVCIMVYRRREAIFRWYYFLTPHPLHDMVRDTIERDVPLDGKALSALLEPVPGGRIKNEVRTVQARDLTEQARRHFEKVRDESERLMEKARSDADLMRAHNELGQAAKAHQQAKARLDALRKRVG